MPLKRLRVCTDPEIANHFSLFQIHQEARHKAMMEGATVKTLKERLFDGPGGTHVLELSWEDNSMAAGQGMDGRWISVSQDKFFPRDGEVVLATSGMPCFLQPFLVEWKDGKWQPVVMQTREEGMHVLVNEPYIKSWFRHGKFKSPHEVKPGGRTLYIGKVGKIPVSGETNYEIFRHGVTYNSCWPGTSIPVWFGDWGKRMVVMDLPPIMVAETNLSFPLDRDAFALSRRPCGSDFRSAWDAAWAAGSGLLSKGSSRTISSPTRTWWR